MFEGAGEVRLFGDWDRFCIVTQLDEHYCGVWLNGELFYRIDGQDFGSRYGGVSLRDALYISEYIVETKEKRINKTLYDMAYERLFALIDDAIYGDNEELFQYIDENVFAGDFSISINVQSMLGTKIFAVSYNGKTKIVYCKSDDHKISGLVFDDESIDHAFRKTYEYLKILHDKEVEKAAL